MPHLPQRMGAPYLGQQYVASSLLADGHDVRCLDLAAVRFDGDDDVAVAEAERFGPDLIGMTLFTYNALSGYRLASRLRHTTGLLVAGGPHPTVLPEEPLQFGFDVSVAGEGEHTLVALARHADGRGALESIPGTHFRGGRGPGKSPIEDLDGLAFPLRSYPCYDARQYSADAMVVPGGLMTSRGCPARCTFCANYVTGRAYRWRSPENVVAEMVALRERYGVAHFPFWDDAFTARRSRLHDLCDAMLAEPKLAGITWTCITPGNMVRPVDLARMRDAGCVAINFGIESGDATVLRAIRKGQRPERIRAAVAAARAAGMTTVVNFMFGFPGEGLPELENTLDLMESLAPDTDFFNNRGVLVPFPGTGIYDRWKDTFGFARWWLDPAKVPDGSLQGKAQPAPHPGRMARSRLRKVDRSMALFNVTKRFQGASRKALEAAEQIMKGKEVKVAARPSVLGSQLKTLAEQPAIQAKQVAAETQNIVEKAGRAAKSVAGTVQSEIDSAILTAPARKRMIEAVRDGLNMWKPQAKFTHLTIMAVSAIGTPGCLDGPELEPHINASPGRGAGEDELELRRAVAAGVSECFAMWQDHVTVPGAPWYPAFAAWPGPMAPPTPNVPFPLIACPSAKASMIMIPGDMSAKMCEALSPPPSQEVKSFLSGVAQRLATAFSVWLASAQVMLVLGKGPVPSFAPPYVPVGPVVGGDILSVPGHLSAAPPLTVLP